MTTTATTKLLITASLLTLTIGLIDAGISGDWDLFVIFLIAIGLSLTLLIRLESRRPAIPISVIWWHGSKTARRCPGSPSPQ